MYPFKKILYSSLSLVAKAIVASGRSPPEKVDFKTPAFFFPKYDLMDCQYLSLPKIEISFSGRPNTMTMDMIEKAGGEAIRIKGQAKDVYVIRTVLLVVTIFSPCCFLNKTEVLFCGFEPKLSPFDLLNLPFHLQLPAETFHC
jgi:hypothetical protein